MRWRPLSQACPPQTKPLSRIFLALLFCLNPIFLYLLSTLYLGCLATHLKTIRGKWVDTTFSKHLSVWWYHTRTWKNLLTPKFPALDHVLGPGDTKIAVTLWGACVSQNVVLWWPQDASPGLLIKIRHCLGKGAYSGDTWGGHLEFTFLACCHFAVL